MYNIFHTKKYGIKISVIAAELSLLDAYCKEKDFAFNLAGVNRSKNTEDLLKNSYRIRNNKCKKITLVIARFFHILYYRFEGGIIDARKNVFNKFFIFF